MLLKEGMRTHSSPGDVRRTNSGRDHTLSSKVTGVLQGLEIKDSIDSVMPDTISVLRQWKGQ